MREMAFLPQEYMMFQPHHNHHHHSPHHSHNPHHDFEDDHHHQDPSISLNILSSCPPQDFQGAGGVPPLSMMNRSMSFSSYHQQQHDHENHVENDNNNEQDHDQDHDQNHQGGGGDQDDLSDDGSQVLVVGPGGGEKKKRLNLEQVKTLEKHFEQGNKLEPDRKVQLAKALNLQPRQVAIWFQNRRARWKTKQLEKDYGVLKRQFDAVKADNDSLLAQNKKLHAELMALRNRETTEYGAINLNNADTKSYWSNNGSEISSDINLGSSRTPQAGSPLSSNPSTKPLSFPQNTFMPASLTQLLQSTPTSKPELDLQCPKIDPPMQEDSFCNMFTGNGGGGGGGGGNGVIDQTPTTASFWAWPEQQHLS